MVEKLLLIAGLRTDIVQKFLSRAGNLVLLIVV